MHILLVEPLIPQNTGSIARLCVATGTHLHLVEPLGFSLEDRYLKRAGLDYWPHVKLHVHCSLDAALEGVDLDQTAWYSSHAARPYTEFAAGPEAWFVFGKETTGLGAELRAAHAGRLYKIPTTKHVRSLNLAQSAAVVLYEAQARQGFPGLD